MGGNEGREKVYGAPRKKFPIAALLQRGGTRQSSVFSTLTFEATGREENGEALGSSKKVCRGRKFRCMRKLIEMVS